MPSKLPILKVLVVLCSLLVEDSVSVPTNLECVTYDLTNISCSWNSMVGTNLESIYKVCIGSKCETTTERTATFPFIIFPSSQAINITESNSQGSATSNFLVTEEDIVFIPPAPEKVMLNITSLWTLSVSWTDEFSKCLHMEYQIQVLLTEKMQVVYNGSYFAHLENAGRIFQLTWTSSMPLECTSHSVQIRGICQDKFLLTKKVWSPWSPLTTIPGADKQQRSEILVLPLDSVTPVGSNMTFCCIVPSGYSITSIMYGSEKLPLIDLGSRSKAIIKYNQPFSSSSGANIICNADPNESDGTVIFVGYPPDDHQLTCETRDLKTINCMWNKGRPTHLLGLRRTVYEIIERISGNSTSCHSALNGQTNTCLLMALTDQNHYKFLLKAKNQLGESEATDEMILEQRVCPKEFKSVDIMFVSSRDARVSLSWEDSFEKITLLCQVQLQTIDSLDVRNYTLAGPAAGQRFLINLDHLHPFTAYNFQVRCSSADYFWKWNNWTPAMTFRTKEEASSKAPDVWRTIKDTGSGIILTVVWKPLSRSEANGIITNYEITIKDLFNNRTDQHISVSGALNTSTVPLGYSKYTVLVTASNLAGMSPTSEFSVATLTDFDNILSIVYNRGGYFNLSWPQSNNVTCGYVVEWYAFMDQQMYNLQWMKFPSNLSEAKIASDTFEGGILYHFNIYGCTDHGHFLIMKKQGYSLELAPSHAVKFKVLSTTSSSVILEWKSLPIECQRGFIRGYVIYYMQQVNSNSSIARSGSPGEKWINITDPDIRNWTVTQLKSTNYQFTVTAYTEGGESPREMVFVSLNDNSVGLILAILIPLGAIAVFTLLVSVFCYKKRKWVKDTFYPEIPKPEINGSDWPVNERVPGNSTLEVQPCMVNGVQIVESMHGEKDAEILDICKVETISSNNSQIEEDGSESESINHTVVSYYPQIVDDVPKSSSDTSSGSVDSCLTQVTYTGIQQQQQLSESKNVEGYRPQMKLQTFPLNLNETAPSPDLPEPSTGYQPQTNASSWSLESPEVNASIGSPTSVNSTQFLLPDQAAGDEQQSHALGWAFTNFFSSTGKH
ncbi:LIF receptor subunit alpha a [Polypterus senegalus]|uniref:LIF receptor subunit alpha a n=1 Tax=Polypterus senegalus TaxID=55291 RepID=UPI001963E0C5|nr:LIF receptor subunit alpha a [Polypterus senegalus]XP_039606580.1 LIF receptor subunit alpha a [Polypterus senegalus]XP_039606581.1 LIF receptor subunit alpha a [Polypterus senegalus]